MNKILELRQKRVTLWEKTKNYLEEHRGENGMVDAASLEQYNRMVADVKALGDEIQRLEDQMALDAQLSVPTTAPVQNAPAGKKTASAPTATEAYNKAFWDNMRGNVSPEVRNALSVGEDANGGYTVPDEFHRQLVEALEGNNVFRRMANVIRTSSGTRTIPVAADNGQASWVEEGNAIAESDLTFSVQTLSAFKLACLIRVSNELLNDSAFDIGAHIAKRFGVRFGNAEENAFINGRGVSSDPGSVPSEPTGILTTLSTPSVTTAGAGSITFDDVYRLYYALKGPYRRTAKFLCNETVLMQLMLLKDKNGNYIWKPGLDVAKPDTILGHEIVTSTYMPSLEGASSDAGKKVLLFGDFGYYWLADRTNRTMKRLNELYAVNDQIGFLGTQRVDGKLILPEAMKVLGMGGAEG